jgi:predicted deacylase
MERNESNDLPTRVIGRVGDGSGPTLVCVGSLHGNEPAGVVALKRVFAELDAAHPSISGEFVGVAGNLAALAMQQRYVDHDLNRCWRSDRVERLRTGDTPSSLHAAEDTELLEVLSIVDEVAGRARGEVFFLDLHTTSGNSPSFGTIADTLRNRAFALRFPVPIILGLEEHLDGTFLEYVNNLGFVTMGFEGGQHNDPTSVDRIEQCIWVGLAAAGVLSEQDGVPQVAIARQALASVAEPFPRVLEVRHRHPVAEGDGFRMEPGFASFDPVRAGQLLARDRTGPLPAREAGRVLLPLYQPQGDDGFFLMREFSDFWLGLSAMLRRLRLDAMLHVFPGVARSRAEPHTLIIDRRVARWFALQVAHLLGYRKRRMDGETLIVTRRSE